MRTGTSMVDRMFRNLTNVRRLIVAVLVATVMLLLQSAVLPKPATTQCRSTMTRRVTRHRVPTRRRLANAALRSETTRNPDRPPRAYDLPPILLPQTLHLRFPHLSDAQRRCPGMRRLDKWPNSLRTWHRLAGMAHRSVWSISIRIYISSMGITALGRRCAHRWTCPTLWSIHLKSSVQGNGVRWRTFTATGSLLVRTA